MPTHTRLNHYQVYTGEASHVVHTPAGRGEELRVHLHAHGIDAAVRSGAESPFDRVEVARDVSPETLQAILDHWER